MSNVLSEHKRQQVLALGRLGWPLRRIEEETGIRRETPGAYLKAAGIVVRRVAAKGIGGVGDELAAPFGNLVRVDVEALREFGERLIAFDRGQGHFGLEGP